MEIREIKQKAFVFDREELSKLKYILNYAWHRAAKHSTPISEHKGFIDYFRKQIDV